MWPLILVGERFFVVAPWRKNRRRPDVSRSRDQSRHAVRQRGNIRVRDYAWRPWSGPSRRGRARAGRGHRIGNPVDRREDAGRGNRRRLRDIDDEVAREAPYFVGSVDAVRGGAFDVVVVNISEVVIGERKAESSGWLRGEFCRCFKTLAASGLCVMRDQGRWPERWWGVSPQTGRRRDQSGAMLLAHTADQGAQGLATLGILVANLVVRRETAPPPVRETALVEQRPHHREIGGHAPGMAQRVRRAVDFGSRIESRGQLCARMKALEIRTNQSSFDCVLRRNSGTMAAGRSETVPTGRRIRAAAWTVHQTRR